jgi:hypothetical protein
MVTSDLQSRSEYQNVSRIRIFENEESINNKLQEISIEFANTLSYASNNRNHSTISVETIETQIKQIKERNFIKILMQVGNIF